jgi:nucleoside-diphosphate-sugar epimerase
MMTYGVQRTRSRRRASHGGLVAPYVASFALDTSMRVSNAKAHDELGWRPAYPTFREGIEAMVAAHAGASGGD